MSLELNSLIKALNSLERSIAVAEKKADSNCKGDEIEVIIAGVIQNFEFTYELCWKFMKRWLSENIGATYVDGITRKELFRLASENKLIEKTEKWFEFHTARNRTSHVYDEDVAQYVYSIAKQFLPEAKIFLERIENRND